MGHKNSCIPTDVVISMQHIIIVKLSRVSAHARGAIYLNAFGKRKGKKKASIREALSGKRS
jgi:hypothetical protein